MDEVFRIEPFSPNETDDLLLTASSFEERCLGAARLLTPSYKARCCFIAHLDSKTTPEGELAQKYYTSELFTRLSWADVLDRACLKPVRAHDFSDLWESLLDELQEREIALEGSSVSIDITCFTRLHIVFLIRRLRRISPVPKLRLLYSVPVSYVTESGRNSDLVFGKYQLLTVPFESTVASTPLESSSLRRICIVSVGHEGDRVLNIWRSLEPERTYIVRTKTPNKQSSRVTATRNAFLLGRLKKSDPAFRLLSAANPYTAEIVDSLEELHQNEAKNGPYEISFIPFGPKLVSVRFADWAIKHPEQRVNICYSVPEGYNGRYSNGIRSVFEEID